MSSSELSSYFLEKIQSGNAILFLGAGASQGAIRSGKSMPLSGDALRDAISDKFLDGALKEKSLAQVAEIAKDGPGLFAIQEFIKEQFEGLKPAAFHLSIPSFRWRAIVTTNYDFVIEQAYRDAPTKRQKLFPLLGDNDNFAEATADLDSLPFLKLHGCLSRVNDPDYPLILASEEYAKHKRNRGNLFQLFSDWAREYPILFVGYDLSDPNITQILYDIGDSTINRPRHALIKRSFTEYETRYYQSRRIDPVQFKFEDLIAYLDAKIPEHKRTLAALVENASTLSKWIKSGTESDGLAYYLSTELEYVHIDLGSASTNPKEFFNGLDSPWGVFKEEYDSKRNVTETILLEVVLEQELEETSKLFLINGHAGSGKTTILKRVAWDAATKYSRLVFYLNDGGSLKREFLEEIWQITQEPFCVFVDCATKHINEIKNSYSYFKRYNIPVTFIVDARTNEWNVSGGDLNKDISKSYEVIDMTDREIGSLLEKLESFKCLGALSEIPKENRTKHIKVTAEKQLLVALLEATQGKPLHDIVIDEYNNITPSEARILYLDVCTLHRFGVAVRSGLISRISNITFDYFASRLMKPLEHVIRNFTDSYSRDHAYRSRHPEIARIVFDSVLDTPERKVNQIVRILSNMNIDYESDRVAFEQIIKGHNVSDAFADKNLGEKIYYAALKSGANESYVLHQQAIFELNHPNGNYEKALSLIEKSFGKAKYGQKSIKHTKALILRRLAQDAAEPLLKDRYRAEAKTILKQQLHARDSSYSYIAILSILLDELKERFDALDSSGVNGPEGDRVSEELVTDIEDFLYRGSQDNPGDEVLLSTEAKYAELIGENPRAKRLIEAAFIKNPNSPYTAISFSKLKESSGDFDGAFEVLSNALDHSPATKQLHLNIAKLCIRHKEREYINFIDSHLRSAFSDGDSNYEAQYWYARHNFLYGDRNKAKKIYHLIHGTNIPHYVRDKKRGIVRNPDGSPIIYSGLVTNKMDTFCFVSCHEINENVFIHYYDFTDVEWEKVNQNVKISFQLGFSLRGPVGLNALLVDD